MTHEQEAPVLSIEHWNFQMARNAGHPEVAEMGIYVDVAVVRENDRISSVRKIKELKIEWERFKRDEGYAGGILKAVEAMMSTT